jgi:hypothetical protein
VHGGSTTPVIVTPVVDSPVIETLLLSHAIDDDDDNDDDTACAAAARVSVRLRRRRVSGSHADPCGNGQADHMAGLRVKREAPLPRD